jgi:nitroreductase
MALYEGQVMCMTVRRPGAGYAAAPEYAPAIPIPEDQVGYLITTAARAPSVHNTQPWRFKVGEDEIELYADQCRKLRVDPAGREMLISCGAALFGLRLAIRSLGCRPIVELLPDPARLRLLARVRMSAGTPLSDTERLMLEAVPHRHTHRGPFADEPLPDGLLAALQHDARAEGATLALVEPAIVYQRLADIVTAASRRLDLDPVARTEVRRWSRAMGSTARDGVPAQAFPAKSVPANEQRGRLRQRDFDLGRELGLLAAGGPPAAATAVLVTRGDGRADWLRAGQALHRLLARAADRWVFASLYTQPLEAAVIRDLIRTRLGLPGAPQMLLQLGRARTTLATARRPPAELMEQ